MSELLNPKAFETQNDNLIASAAHDLDAKIISIKTGRKYERGTVLCRSTDGSFFVYGEEGKDGKANCIVAEDLDAMDIKDVEYMTIDVYVSGTFKANQLTGKAELDEDAEEELRQCGIFLK